MDLGLKNKIAFVAASSQGLGKAVAIELVKEGAKLIINGRNKEVLENTKQEIEKINNEEVFAVAGDLSIADEREQVIKNSLQTYDHIDILITNTGGPPSGKFEDFKLEDWDNAYKSLLVSVVGLINGFLPGMKQQRWGRIIAITSQAVKQPVNNLVLSNAVRASVAGLLSIM